MNGTSISPAAINLIPSTFVNQMGGAFTSVSHYALSLFYIIAGIEIALFGLAWALKQDEALASFLFKVIKLGFIFFIITSFPYLAGVLISGFTDVAISAAGGPTVAKFILHPTNLWQYSFDTSISLLTLSVQYGTTNMGITLIYLFLGMGMLFMFALIAAEIVLVIVAFYVLALLALLLIPFGAMTPTRNLFEKSIQSLLSAGARVFTVIIVLGAGVSVWSQFNIGAISQSTSLIQPLSVFFVTLVFLVLMLKLPPMAAKSIGQVGGSYFGKMMGAQSVSVNVAAPSVSTTLHSHGGMGVAGGVQSTAAAASMVAASGAHAASSMQTASSTVGSSASPNVTVNAQTRLAADPKAGKLRAGADVQQGISRETLSKLKATFKQVLDEKGQS